VSAEVGLALRAPWYVRERGAGLSLRDAPALRPTIQMYDGTDFVDRLLADPRDSLQYTADDLWSYPVPVTPGTGLKGRERFATSRLVTSNLRKLYQPSHGRFYAVVVEVFCDVPGLPRAGEHDDIEVTMVVRRQHTRLFGTTKSIRTLARNLMVDLMDDQHPGATVGDDSDLDVRDLWTATEARRRFEEQNKDLLALVSADTSDQGWMVGPAGGQWRVSDAPPAEGRPADREEELPMWRLPGRQEDCDAARTRSLWFGLVPTYSADHWVDACGRARPKLDDRATYQVRCIARHKPVPGHEHCPRTAYVSQPSEPFRLASPFDPDGTKNRTVSITLPDLRRLAARAGQRQGPGGVRISTPPRSQLVVNPFGDIPKSGAGRIGAGGGVCTFALELFFIVAFFLFLMFLPIVVFAFQLWWMLALRFCIPPSASFDALAEFFADGKLLADVALDARLEAELDVQFGTDTRLFPSGAPERGTWRKELTNATDADGTPIFRNDADLTEALVRATDPRDAVKPAPPALEEKPPDPLCPKP
jgi:hypothetical protein